MEKIRTIYVKELNDMDEIFKENSKLPIFLKRSILFLKKIFCIITINKENVCILPYKKLDNFKLLLIKKILVKLRARIVLSNYLETLPKLKQMLKDSKLEQIDGRSLSNYLILEMIEYICKMMQEEIQRQEITLLVQTLTQAKKQVIVDLAKKVKRIQIVTDKIGQFKKLENELEESLGLACQITNNKRKSLLKSKIIINFDYLEEKLNQFTINPNAIVIDINMQTQIYSKVFCGIHVYDYQINTDNLEMINNTFEMKKVYGAKIIEKKYRQIREILKEDNIRVINLIGKKGIICREEYTRLLRK